jgi:hypothetical protein
LDSNVNDRCKDIRIKQMSTLWQFCESICKYSNKQQRACWKPKTDLAIAKRGWSNDWAYEVLSEKKTFSCQDLPNMLTIRCCTWHGNWTSKGSWES